MIGSRSMWRKKNWITHPLAKMYRKKLLFGHFGSFSRFSIILSCRSQVWQHFCKCIAIINCLPKPLLLGLFKKWFSCFICSLLDYDYLEWVKSYKFGSTIFIFNLWFMVLPNGNIFDFFSFFSNNLVNLCHFSIG